MTPTVVTPMTFVDPNVLVSLSEEASLVLASSSPQGSRESVTPSPVLGVKVGLQVGDIIGVADDDVAVATVGVGRTVGAWVGRPAGDRVGDTDVGAGVGSGVGSKVVGADDGAEVGASV